MTVAKFAATIASLRCFQTGLGLGEVATRRGITEVAAEGEREPAAFRDEVRRQMMAASRSISHDSLVNQA